jgi:hypothetical protein
MAAEAFVEAIEIADKVFGAPCAKQQRVCRQLLEPRTFAIVGRTSDSVLIGVTQFRIMIERPLDALDGFDG